MKTNLKCILTAIVMTMLFYSNSYSNNVTNGTPAVWCISVTVDVSGEYFWGTVTVNQNSPVTVTVCCSTIMWGAAYSCNASVSSAEGLTYDDSSGTFSSTGNMGSIEDLVTDLADALNVNPDSITTLKISASSTEDVQGTPSKIKPGEYTIDKSVSGFALPVIIEAI